MTRPIYVIGLVVAGIGGVTSIDTTHVREVRRAPLAIAGGMHTRPGADSARVARLLTALGQTDPVVCDLIGDQLGNFWMGNDDARLGRFADAADVQGAKDSLAGSITDPRAIGLLVASIDSNNACVRRVAAKLLGNSTVSAAVLGRLLDDAQPRARESAAYAAGVGERRETRAGLERRLTDSEPSVAAMAAWALGEIRDPASAPELQKAVHSTSPRVRLAGIWALGQFNDAAFAKDVLPFLRDPDAGTRVIAAEALGEMKSPRVGAALVGALTDRSIAVRRTAANALGNMSERSAAPTLESLLLNDPDPDVRRECANALGNISLGRSLEPLARALDDADRDVQREAANAIGNLDEVKKAPAALIRATSSSDVDLRREATDALAHIGDQGSAAVQALLDRLRDEDKGIRLAAVQGLGELNVAAAIPGLTRALNDRDPDVRQAAAEALGKTQ
jgi:HEAT repeat protein